MAFVTSLATNSGATISSSASSSLFLRRPSTMKLLSATISVLYPLESVSLLPPLRFLFDFRIVVFPVCIATHRISFCLGRVSCLLLVYQIVCHTFLVGAFLLRIFLHLLSSLSYVTYDTM